MGVPHGHRKTTTLVAGLRMTGTVAPMVLDGPINREWFEAYVRQVLVPELRRGDIVIMDNLSARPPAWTCPGASPVRLSAAVHPATARWRTVGETGLNL